MFLRIVTFLALSQLAAGVACAAGFAPHLAEYELYLDRNALGNDVVASGGRMEIRYEKSCEFWTTTFMFNFDMVLANGAPINIGFVSWSEESLDGSTYRFEHAELSMGEIVQAMAGTAHTGTDAPAEAIFTMPERNRVSLPAGTVFPIAAWQDLLDNVADGKNAAAYTLFDGWDIEGPGILRLWASHEELDPAAQHSGPEGGSDLMSGSSWQISSAYFPFGSSDMEPVSSGEEHLFDTGVSNPILFDWDEFAIGARATSVTALPSPDC